MNLLIRYFYLSTGLKYLALNLLIGPLSLSFSLSSLFLSLSSTSLRYPPLFLPISAGFLPINLEGKLETLDSPDAKHGQMRVAIGIAILILVAYELAFSPLLRIGISDYSHEKLHKKRPDKFIYFYAHAGFSNQLYALQR